MSLYLLAFAIGTVLFIPSSVFLIAGGAFFGLYKGYLLGMTGFTLGACGCFVTSRFLFHDLNQRLLPERIKNNISRLQDHGWKLVATLRIAGLVPASVISYALGITRIPLAVFAWASCVFTLPVGLLFTYAGVAGKDFIESGNLQKFLLSFFAFAFMAVILIILRRLYIRRRHLQTNP